MMIQTGLGALGQGGPPLTDLDAAGVGGAHHHGPVRQDPRNQGLRIAHFRGNASQCSLLPHFICEALGTAQTHTEHMGKARSAAGPLQPGPAPTWPRRQARRPQQALSLPALLENRCGPAQTPTSPPGLLGRAQTLQRPARGAEPALPRQVQLPDPRACPRLPFPPTQCGRTPTPSLALCQPHPVAPERSRPRRLRGRTEQGGWEGRVARGARPGDRKQSSPERAAPGRTRHTWAAAPQAWCGPHRGQGRQAGGQPLGPGACAESRASSDAAVLMAQQPAALAPGGHQLRSSGNRASLARRHEKLIPRPEAHACTYATPTHTLGRHDTRDKARPCRRPQSFS